MALAHAILSSLLVDGPCSGYDLVKRFDECISCFWLASHPQIYKELRTMEQRGWVSRETVVQTGRPNKHVYSVTPDGQTELTDWIAIPSEPTSIREDLMIKTLAGHLVPRPVLLAELQRRRDLHYEKLMVLRQTLQEEYAGPLSYGLTLHYLSLRRGIRYETEWVEWCEEAMQLIAATPEVTCEAVTLDLEQQLMVASR
jgi:DNA-binding PadR family transcriptional regulator